MTSLLALRLRYRERTPMSYDAAWRLARVTRHPDDLVYRLDGHSRDDPKRHADQVHVDDQ
ncbi:hypothetical protein [Kitasatospora sp. NBC_00039]|uniref:hypothetical protein n=1 Tax=Kitasatospora sp. NBC_00039 TaxID=2903565 RepID=UPI00324B0A8A